jgi:preprotein translocase subunit SecD
MITCVILYWFGNTFGAFMVKGFAITLFLGVVVSLFSSVTVTRTFMTQLVNNGMIKGVTLYGGKND